MTAICLVMAAALFDRHPREAAAFLVLAALTSGIRRLTHR